MSEQNENIADDGVKLLLTQYKGKENFEANVKAILAPVQTQHNDVWEILHGLSSIDSLSLYLLDVVGSWVGVKRQGRSDAEMLQAIKIAIAVNTSSGTIDQVEAFANLITGSTFAQVTERSNFTISIFCNADLSNLESIPDSPFTYSGPDGTGYGEGAYVSSTDYDGSLYIPILKKVVMGGVRIADLTYLESTFEAFAYGGEDGSGYGEGAYATSIV